MTQNIPAPSSKRLALGRGPSCGVRPEIVPRLLRINHCRNGIPLRPALASNAVGHPQGSEA